MELGGGIRTNNSTRKCALIPCISKYNGKTIHVERKTVTGLGVYVPPIFGQILMFLNPRSAPD